MMDMDLEESSSSSMSSEVPIFHEIKKLVWGLRGVNDDLFRRWSQGFTFSPDEPTALIQVNGGPCGVIAPVQAFLLKAILADPNVLIDNQWRNLKPEQVDTYLVQALTEILKLTSTSSNIDPNIPSTSTLQDSSKLQQVKSYNPSASSGISSDLTNNTTTTTDDNDDPMMSTTTTTNSTSVVPPQVQAALAPNSHDNKIHQYCLVFLSEPLNKISSSESDSETVQVPESNSRRHQKSEQEIFHRNLRVLYLENINQVETVLREKIEVLKGHQYGVLQFLYSVILTKGIQNLKNEMWEPTEECSELIDPVHGHGSQSLINLMLCGRGISHLWNGDQDVGGLTLKGIVQQNVVGFLTLLENLRFIEVGSYFKSPQYPVWVVASETHLTVIFSFDMKLVAPETNSEAARRVFHTYDPEGNNFIASVLLEDVMRTLGLYADTDYVELMKKKLDPEVLGIILLNDFMYEFFPNEISGAPDTFVLYHYNGLACSSSQIDKKVIYQEGQAILLESDIRCISENNKILTCLQTKWPNIDIQWKNNNPSIY